MANLFKSFDFSSFGSYERWAGAPSHGTWNSILSNRSIVQS